MMTGGGSDDESGREQPGRHGAILSRSVLMRMATGYLARYAASSVRLRQVLTRRIRRRVEAEGFEVPDPHDLAVALDDVVARLETLGLLDDHAFAAGRTRALQRKGLPERRIRLALRDQGVSAPDEEASGIDDVAQARRYTARKRLGPFRKGDRAPYRDKDLRSLLRAGFSFRIAVEAVDAEVDQD